MAEWKNRFLKLDTFFGIHYGLIVEFGGELDPVILKADEPQFTQEGLKLIDAQINWQTFIIRNGQDNFYSQHTTFSSNITLKHYTIENYNIERNHITLTRDYTEPDANFTVSKEMKICLMPSINLFVGGKQKFVGSNTEQTLYNYVCQAINRETLLPGTGCTGINLNVDQNFSEAERDLAIDYHLHRINSRACK